MRCGLSFAEKDQENDLKDSCEDCRNDQSGYSTPRALPELLR